MSKPTIFFSHSSADKESLVKLKELFVEKTGATIDVFLSSDGQSIPFGRNWVQKIQDALAEAKIMFVFLTPNSIESKWIYFESGFSYSKNIRVIPIGFLGVDLNNVKPPLSLLQGFNITSQEGFNNIISTVNEEFSFKHSLSFDETDYKKITFSQNNHLASIFGENLQFISLINFYIHNDEWIFGNSSEVLDAIITLAESENYEYQKNGDLSINFHGIEILNYSSYLEFKVNPLFFDIRSDLIEKLLLKSLKDGINGFIIELSFHYGVEVINSNQNLSSKIYDTEIKFYRDGKFIYKDLIFEFRGKNIKFEIHDELNVKKISELCEVLFKKEVIFATQNFYSEFY
jgi:hypothetical protein